MKVVMEDKFLNKNQCKHLINFYNSQPDKFKFNTTFPLTITKIGPQFLKDKINQAGMDINNSVIDWFEIVKWPSPDEGKALHMDKPNVLPLTLSSIIYLNDNYEGGHTYFEDGTTFAPVTGRAIFFDGQYYPHGVSAISKGPRYTIATWFTHARGKYDYES